MYVAWAVLYEGETDASYFDVLIPRILEDRAFSGPRLPTIPLTPAIRLKRANPQLVAEEACEAREAFHLIFIHADTGGRSLERGIDARGSAYCEAIRRFCDWPRERCIVIAPRHETEAWVLSDSEAILETLGYTGTPESIGLPATAAAAERLSDPKAVLEQAAATIRGRRRPIKPDQIFPAIAQRQRLIELRKVRSFLAFEAAVSSALQDLRLL